MWGLIRIEMLEYKRGRFDVRLSEDRFYRPAHYWLLELEPSMWRVGFTAFATRMLGDPVEFGRKIGWIEGLKAHPGGTGPVRGREGRCRTQWMRTATRRS